MKIFTREQEREFLTTFGLPLRKYYSSFTGFEIIKFGNDLFPGHMSQEGSLEEMVREKYGETAVSLVKDLLALGLPSYPDNSSLKKLPDGTKTKFVYQEGMFANQKFVEDEGTVYWPWVIHLEPGLRRNVRLTHLPTGTYLVKNITRKRAKELIKRLEPFKDALKSTKFSTTTYKEVSKLLADFNAEK